ncbi:MAG: flagellar motor protein MotA [Geminicoccaceae bacterium]
MSSLNRYVFIIIIVLLLTGAAVALSFDVTYRIFSYNPPLNSAILVVFLFGVGYAFRRIFTLKPEIRWIEAFRAAGPGFSLAEPPRLLAPIATALGEYERRTDTELSTVSIRYLLDSVASRLDEQRDNARYLTGLLIFLGLLGTFWGLLETISSVGDVIADLSIGSGDIAVVFDDLKAGLAAPLSGMGTAFSSSLFGLAGSLILGFLDLQANQAQNSFYNDMEEWLSGLARFGDTVDDRGRPAATLGPSAPMPAYIQALLERTAESLENLDRLISRSEETRHNATDALNQLAFQLDRLNENAQSDRNMMAQLVRMQDETRQALMQAVQGEAGANDAFHQYLHSVDTNLKRLIDESSRGREQLVRELRGEIKTVTKTIAIAAGDAQLDQR